MNIFRQYYTFKMASVKTYIHACHIHTHTLSHPYSQALTYTEHWLLMLIYNYDISFHLFRFHALSCSQCSRRARAPSFAYHVYGNVGFFHRVRASELASQSEKTIDATWAKESSELYYWAKYFGYYTRSLSVSRMGEYVWVTATLVLKCVHACICV